MASIRAGAGSAPRRRSQDVEDPAPQSLALDLDLLEEPLEDVTLAGFLRDQLQRWQTSGWPMRWMRPNRLLDAVRVPRQVVVHHQVRALEVYPLTSGVGGDEDTTSLFGVKTA